jgi:hypothetical protein
MEVENRIKRTLGLGGRVKGKDKEKDELHTQGERPQ